MNSVTLSLAYLRHRLLATLLTILTFVCGMGVIIALLLLHAQMQNEFTRNLQGIDLVVGGKGSPMQLILSSVFHLDIPTGNIPQKEADNLRRHPLVKSAIPVALGDNYNGHRIVGTTPDYIAHYGGKLVSGAMYNNPMEAIVGSEVAEKNKVKLGDKIVGAHGLVNSDDLHTDFPYTITGILAPTGTVLDRLVLTPVESVWHVHEHPDPDDAEEIAYKKEHPGKEITALLISYKSPMAAASLPRLVNSTTSMQAASPAYEVARLTKFMGIGEDTLEAFGLFLILLAGLSLFSALSSALDERRYDLALMRSFGAPLRKLLGLVFAESMVITCAGVLTGIGLGHVLVQLTADWLSATRHVQITGALWLPAEGKLALAGLCMGLLTAIIPALRVYRIDIFKTLVQR